MFTGIIEAMGDVISAEITEGMQAKLRTTYPAAEIALGDSVACNGACLTVISIESEANGSVLGFDISPETLRCTALGDWREGMHVNLERAMPASGRFDGHIVTGHVDGLAKLESIQQEGNSYIFTFTLPEDLARFVAAKGSITLDGISLTVNTVDTNRFTVAIVPHTWAHTTLQYKKAGDSVHVEVDIVARYIARMTEFA